ncbi:MarR family winged helix-turn-helix transcriptional regulator [Larkinella terrae]|uniref:Winged helix DNA-binding protein n=1 Tax=Larkinella terrae TaxID=2025311 RepID=A0A7K0EIH5_9BACT|nr:MarR family winged helix-turn-helix transcriptional regulator [Larkinella terrae]MRS61266.1 winged helix DNA-binding protein [Larkinella terrae]
MSHLSAIPVLTAWERFCDEQPQGGLREFASWLLHHLDPLRQSPDLPDSEPIMKSGQRLSEAFDSEDFLAGFFIGRLGRYAKSYGKSIVAAHGFASSDEFLFLSLISRMDQPIKKEVCLANATELTTGMDILRRLVKDGLIQEMPDKRDGRAKRLSLTDHGQAMLNRIYAHFEQIPSSVLADLDEGERRQFIQTLKYLNNYLFQFYRP